MPRLPSSVFQHFSVTKKDGKDVYLCKYCSKQYVKNATKQQKHLNKCDKFPKQTARTQATTSLSAVTPGASTSGMSSAAVESPSTLSRSSSSASATASSTPSISGSFHFDSMGTASKQIADESLARAIYASGSPLMLTENVYWKRFFNTLRPAYSPPTRYALSTHLLEAEYHRVHEKVAETIRNADCVSVISDGWSNIRGEGIINYIVSTPHPVFLKSTDTKDKRHTGKYIADELKTVIETIGSNKVFAVITDNASNMKAAWTMITEAYPHITPIGCGAAHGLSLLLGDIMELKTAKTLYKKAKKVVKYVKARQGVSATFSEKQKAKKKNTSLKLPSKTRWGAVVIMYDSLLDGKESLEEMAIMQSLDIDDTVRKVILDNDVFWARIVNMLKVLSPIASGITQIKGDDALLSDVPKHFKDLKQEITTALPESPMQKQEEKDVIKHLEKREEFCMKPIHAAANMLDPKRRGQDLNDEQINSAYEAISTLARHLQLDVGKVLASLAKFRAKDGLWKGEGIWSSAEHISAATWWKGLCSSEALSPIASVLLQIPPSSASSERNWSIFGNTHTKVRNRLTNEKVEKLVSIRSNLTLFEPNKDTSTQIEVDTNDAIDEVTISSSESESDDLDEGEVMQT